MEESPVEVEDSLEMMSSTRVSFLVDKNEGKLEYELARLSRKEYGASWGIECSKDILKARRSFSVPRYGCD